MSHKLRTGQLHGNRFDISVRATRPAIFLRSRAGRASSCAAGMPNRYGEQRFGRAGDNAEAARKLFGGKSAQPRPAGPSAFSSRRCRPRSSTPCSRSVASATTRSLLGDLARVEVSGGLFWVDDLERDSARAREFEISATGPIFGTKVRAPRGEIAMLEAKVLRATWDSAGGELRLPRGMRAQGTRRAAARAAPRPRADIARWGGRIPAALRAPARRLRHGARSNIWSVRSSTRRGLRRPVTSHDLS